MIPETIKYSTKFFKVEITNDFNTYKYAFKVGDILYVATANIEGSAPTDRKQVIAVFKDRLKDVWYYTWFADYSNTGNNIQNLKSNSKYLNRGCLDNKRPFKDKTIIHVGNGHEIEKFIY